MLLNDDEKQKWIHYAQELLERYYTPERILQAGEDVRRRHEMSVEYGRGGISMYRGYYCRSMIYELYVTNLKRGKLLKKAPRKAPDYAYYYVDDILTLTSQYPNQRNEVIEHIQWNGNVESSILLTPKMEKAEWPEVCVATLNEDGMLEKNVMSTFFMDSEQNITGFDLRIEQYVYEKRLIESSMMYLNTRGLTYVGVDNVRCEYTYREDGTPKGYFMEGYNGYDDIEEPLPEHIKAMMNQKIKHP